MLTITDFIRFGAFSPHSWEREVQHRFDNLIDLIQLRVERDGLEAAMNSLLGEVFALRMMVIPELLSEEGQNDFLNFVLERQLELHDKPTDSYDELYAEVLATLHQISYQHNKTLSEKSVDSSTTIHNFIDGHAGFPTLESFRVALHYSDAPEEFYKMLEASLKADFNCMLYELLKSERLVFLRGYRKQIVQQAFRYTEELGLYSALLSLWKPVEDEEGILVRNVKIRLAMYELNQGINSERWNSDQIKNLILN